MSRETVLTRTLVQLADTLVEEFDLVDVLTLLCERCVEILDVSAVGLMLIAVDGKLQCVASSSDAMRVLEVFEIQTDEGPCPDCYRSGRPVVNVDLTRAHDRWPRFAPRALAAGFRSVHALPMHVRDRTFGALNLFRADQGPLGDADVSVAQALADAATLSIVAQRAAADAHALTDELQGALNSRVLIEQAKGMVAQSLGVDMPQAFSRMRGHARNGNLKLSEVAGAIVDRSLAPHALKPLRGPKSN